MSGKTVLTDSDQMSNLTPACRSAGSEAGHGGDVSVGGGEPGGAGGGGVELGGGGGQHAGPGPGVHQEPDRGRGRTSGVQEVAGGVQKILQLESRREFMRLKNRLNSLC